MSDRNVLFLVASLVPKIRPKKVYFHAELKFLNLLIFIGLKSNQEVISKTKRKRHRN